MSIGKQVEKLIVQSRIKEALNVLINYYQNDKKKASQLVLLQSRFSSYEMDKIGGTMSNDTLRQERNRIVKAVLNNTPKDDNIPQQVMSNKIENNEMVTVAELYQALNKAYIADPSRDQLSFLRESLNNLFNTALSLDSFSPEKVDQTAAMMCKKLNKLTQVDTTELKEKISDLLMGATFDELRKLVVELKVKFKGYDLTNLDNLVKTGDISFMSLIQRELREINALL